MARNWKEYTKRGISEVENPDAAEELQKYIDHKRGAEGVSWRTLRGHARVLKNLANHYPDRRLTDLNRSEIIRHIAALSDEYSENTVAQYKVAIKNFYKVMQGEHGDYPDKVKGIKTTSSRKRKDPDALLSPGEIKAMIQTAGTTQRKAFVAGLYESGARLGEWLGLNIGSVNPDEHGAIIRLNPEGEGLKTGTRRIRLINSDPYLRDWLENHPFKDNPSDPLWITESRNNYGNRLTDSGGRRRIKTVAKRAGIEKRVYPHLLRHSRATELARDGFTETDMKIMLGWSRASDMPARYVHMSGGDVEEKILRFHGLLEEEEEPEDPLEPWTCPRCGLNNGVERRFCGCGLARTPEAAAELEEAEEKGDEELLDADAALLQEIKELRADVAELKKDRGD